MATFLIIKTTVTLTNRVEYNSDLYPDMTLDEAIEMEKKGDLENFVEGMTWASEENMKMVVTVDTMEE